jgi:hypothetical protein
VLVDVTIYSLVKIFEKEQYARDFRDGSLYLNPLSYFREYRDPAGELRGDSMEGVAAIYQPAQSGEIRFGDIVIPPTELAGPITVLHDHITQAKAFCTYALNDHGLDEGAADIPAELLRLFRIHDSCYGLGQFAALILNTTEFIERVSSAARQLKPRAFAHGLVRYFDENTFHGVLGEYPGFYKRRRYERQREHRFLIELPDSNEPLLLHVGDLADIVVVTTPEEISTGLRVLRSDDSSAAE